MIRQYFALKNINQLIKNAQISILTLKMANHNERASINRQFDIIIAKSEESLNLYNFNRTCTYWKEGKCTYGDQCLFQHHTDLNPKKPTTQPSQQQQPSLQQIRASIPCRYGDDCEFYQQGTCRYNHQSQKKRYRKKENSLSDTLSQDGISGIDDMVEDTFESEMKAQPNQVTKQQQVVQNLEKKLIHNKKVYKQQQNYETKIKKFEEQVQHLAPKLESIYKVPYWTQQQINKLVRKHTKKSQSVPPMLQPPHHKSRNTQPQITATAAKQSLLDVTVTTNEDEDSKQMECHDTVTPDDHQEASQLTTTISTTIPPAVHETTPPDTIDFDPSNYLE